MFVIRYWLGIQHHTLAKHRHNHRIKIPFACATLSSTFQLFSTEFVFLHQVEVFSCYFFWHEFVNSYDRFSNQIKLHIVDENIAPFSHLDSYRYNIPLTFAFVKVLLCHSKKIQKFNKIKFLGYIPLKIVCIFFCSIIHWCFIV